MNSEKTELVNVAIIFGVFSVLGPFLQFKSHVIEFIIEKLLVKRYAEL